MSHARSARSCRTGTGTPRCRTGGSGTAASRSTMPVSHLRLRGLEYSVMNRAAITLKGTAMITAMIATITVPVSSPSTPMRGGLTSVRHPSRVRKFQSPVTSSASRARRKRKIPTKVSRARTTSPAPRVTPLNQRSMRPGDSTTLRGVRLTPAAGVSSLGGTRLLVVPTKASPHPLPTCDFSDSCSPRRHLAGCDRSTRWRFKQPASVRTTNEAPRRGERCDNGHRGRRPVHASAGVSGSRLVCRGVGMQPVAPVNRPGSARNPTTPPRRCSTDHRCRGSRCERHRRRTR